VSSHNLCDYDTSHSCNVWPFLIVCMRPPDDAPRPAFEIVLLEQMDNEALGGGEGVEHLNKNMHVVGVGGDWEGEEGRWGLRMPQEQ